MKKYFAVILAGLMAVSLVGCGNSAVDQLKNLTKEMDSETDAGLSNDSALGSDSETPEDPNAITNSKEDVTVTFNVDGGSMGINYREEGSSVGAEWPKDMPSIVPEFKYGLLDAVMGGADEYGAGGSWAAQVSHLQPDAVEKYTQDLADAGWEIDKEYGGAIHATKGNIDLSFDLGIEGEGTGLLTIFGAI